jgi:hypothetical protein
VPYIACKGEHKVVTFLSLVRKNIMKRLPRKRKLRIIKSRETREEKGKDNRVKMSFPFKLADNERGRGEEMGYEIEKRNTSKVKRGRREL